MMNLIPVFISLTFLAALCACTGTDKPAIKSNTAYVYAKEPNDSASYKHLKYDFYLSKDGQLCERKLASAGNTDCHCNFEVYYDSTYSIYTDDTIIEKALNTIVDINSFVWIDSTAFSKDKNNVYYFHDNSDGGNRVIVNKADPATFARLCEHRWGIDKDHVFYKTDILEGLNLKKLQMLVSPDTADPFVDYVKDDRNVFYTDKIVKGADAKTFKVVSGEKWQAEDKNYKYVTGRRY